LKIEKIEIDDYKVFKNFKIDFLDSENNPLDLIVLAGINGSGKTTLFEYIIKTFELEPNILTGKITTNKKGLINKNKIVIVNHPTQNSDEKYGINAREIFIAEFNITYIEAKALNIGIKEEILKYIDFLIYEQLFSAKEAYSELKKEINNIFDGFNLEVQFSNIDKNKNIFFTNSLNEKISIDDLSTGEKELLNKVFSLYTSDIKDSVILIDEPEISLHPSWQNRIVKIYTNFAKQNNNQIIIATHSPQIIASTPNESLRILVKENNSIKAISKNAYGMDINKALTDIMGVNELRDVEVENQYEKVKNMVHKNLYKEEGFQNEFDKLENMMENDNIEFGFLKLELLKRQQNASNN
jgi:predicted ATP-binding protein involved in virulence